MKPDIYRTLSEAIAKEFDALFAEIEQQQEGMGYVRSSSADVPRLFLYRRTCDGKTVAQRRTETP